MAAGQGETLKLERYAPEAKALVAGAQELADELGHAEVTPLHLLARGVDRDRGVAEVLRLAGAEPAELLRTAEAELRKLPRAGRGVAYVSARLLDLLARAEREAARDRAPAVRVDHLLHALSQELRGPAGEVLAAFGVAPGAFRPHVAALGASSRGASALSPAPRRGGAPPTFTKDLTAAARGGESDPVIGRDAEVRRLLQILERRRKNHPLLVGEPGVGKSTIVRALADRIARGDVPASLAGARLNLLDTGSLVAGAKLRGEIEQRLKGVVDALLAEEGSLSILVIEDVDALFGQGAAGAGVGELLRPILAGGELRVLATTTPDGLRRMQERDPIVLRRLSVLGLEPPGVEQAVEVLRGVAATLERHHRVLITEGAVTASVQLARRYLADRALPDAAVDLLDETASRRRVEVDGIPPEVDAALRRVEALRAQLAGLVGDHDRVSASARSRLEAELAELEPRARAMREAIESRRGVIGAVQALRNELAAAQAAHEEAERARDYPRLGELDHVTLPELRARLEAAELAAQRAGVAEAPARVDEADVAETLHGWTGIPVARMLEGEAEKLLRMEERLARRVVGQDEAVRAISRAVRRGRVGLRDPGKPIGSFLFLGPSGVGKTELAKALAEFLFDDEQAMTRLDMSEFMERHMAQRLIGAPPGYADSEQGGHLTEAVRRRPYSVVLFDEVEKAHADVFNLLLQVLDDGRLTDGRGRQADFSNAVVILTSNVGSLRILEADPASFETAAGAEALRDTLQEELRGFFRPEFLNRIDDVVIFKPLGKADLLGIVDIQLRRLDRMLAERELGLLVSDGAKARLVELGYEPALGARPLRRAILRELQNPLAEEILAGGYGAGELIAVDVRDGAFVFAKRAGERAPQTTATA